MIKVKLKNWIQGLSKTRQTVCCIDIFISFPQDFRGFSHQNPSVKNQWLIQLSFHVCLITWTKFKLFELWLSMNKIWTHHNLRMCHCKTKQYFKRGFPVSSRFLLTGNKLSSHFMCRSIISWTPYSKLLQVLKWSLLWSLLLFCFSPASALAELRKMSLETK